MPGGDRTGPTSYGPKTGRAAGYCAGYSVPGFMNPIPGFGRGFGYGRGWRRGRCRGYGRRWWLCPPVVQSRFPEQEIAVLEDYRKDLDVERADLEKEMTEIKSKIEELKAMVEQGEKQRS